ncbi:hypothetical protein L1787_06035 [Acuticoccus sp. M5D2P5]|uniref:hypothetical protein n=1 Tax=Acuticoccus kalidii TaxID=2910977 RepID=UPI001F3C6D9D|nr:hypothetical protein [Acuticoccus kalidii]MCF3932973.1 hypothetical protein [Acuticoccus kalidii]
MKIESLAGHGGVVTVFLSDESEQEHLLQLNSQEVATLVSMLQKALDEALNTNMADQESLLAPAIGVTFGRGRMPDGEQVRIFRVTLDGNIHHDYYAAAGTGFADAVATMEEALEDVFDISEVPPPSRLS